MFSWPPPDPELGLLSRLADDADGSLRSAVHEELQALLEDRDPYGGISSFENSVVFAEVFSPVAQLRRIGKFPCCSYSELSDSYTRVNTHTDSYCLLSHTVMLLMY